MHICDDVPLLGGARTEDRRSDMVGDHLPLVSVVIITRNRPQVLADCLTHLKEQTYTRVEIVVVDSSSNDETADLMQAWPHASFVRIPGGRNNMPQARNLGIATANGDIIAFIDDDCMVCPGWLSQLVSGYSSQDIRGVGGRVIDHRLLVADDDRVGVVEPDGTLIGNFARSVAEPRDVDWLCGGNMSFRTDVFSITGGFDARYTGDNSFEEVDHCIRVCRAGYLLRFIPGAAVVHLAVARNPDNVTRDWQSPLLCFYQTRNRTYFSLKNLRGKRKFLLKSVLPAIWGLTIYTLRRPSFLALKRWCATLAGYCAGSSVWIGYRLSDARHATLDTR